MSVWNRIAAGGLLALLGPGAALAQDVSVDIDTRGAERLLEIACSGAEVDTTEFTGSELGSRRWWSAAGKWRRLSPTWRIGGSA